MFTVIFAVCWAGRFAQALDISPTELMARLERNLQFTLRDNQTWQEVNVREQSVVNFELSASAQKQSGNNPVDETLNLPEHQVSVTSEQCGAPGSV